ncbi:MAG: 2OG-Fe(II) oxygenase [Nannocystaceae bacterium]
MKGETHIRVYDAVVPASTCRGWIELFDESSLVGKGAAQELTGSESAFKVCDELFVREALHRERNPALLERWKRVDQALFEAINPKLVAYIEELKYLMGTPYRDEGFRFKRYPVNEGRFGMHYDATPTTPKRVFSMILYLNDVDEGGETDYPEQGTRIKPKAGRLAVAPPFWTHPHRGNVPISGDKYIVNNFASFR